jgi:hypothetical protein
MMTTHDLTVAARVALNPGRLFATTYDSMRTNSPRSTSRISIVPSSMM